MIFTTGTEHFNVNFEDKVYVSINPNDFRTEEEIELLHDLEIDVVNFKFKGRYWLVSVSAGEVKPGTTIYHKNGKYRGYRLE